MQVRRILSALLCTTALTLSAAAQAYSVNDSGRLLNAQGQEIRLNGVNWFGFETTNYTLHGLWTINWKDSIAQIKASGFNAVRLPFCPNTLRGVAPNSINYSANPDLSGLNSLQLLDKVVKQLSAEGMYVLLDHHRPDCNAISELWYTDSYTEAQWIADLKFVADRYKSVAGVIGLDLKNEPHGAASWGNSKATTDWNKAAERAAKAVLAVAPDWLMFVEGISANDGCSDYRAYWWGGNITPLKCYPLDIPRNRLVLSPHVYGPDVYMQPYFSDSAFPNNMPAIWDAQFGFAASLNYAVVPGEFGGKYGQGQAKDKIWQDKLVDYLIERRITNFFYWSWNPNSGDTGGILQDDWKTVRSDKLALLKRLMVVNASTSSASSSVASSSAASSSAASSAAASSRAASSSSVSSAASSSRAASSAAASSAMAASSSRASSSATSSAASSAARSSAASSAASSASSSSAAGAGSVSASYTVNNDWGSGYCATVRLTNTGSSSVTWSAAMNVEGKLSQMWNATWSQSGSTVSFKGMAWNGSLAAGAVNTSIGFCANR
ncbi:cellulase family glycosylhydrolase [Uliginosibacterium sp. 31-12]|uniref:cellulase family glycosylhydrolase n=1 Tax=Uliginosibacterium sp. 31-12 TaxID=3062781 RepID=UPI0026E369EF|nr:cellulase family glycosylhydrolase [Uliginosibacterium sp. 31-12]MDO6387039.1 cellulase family glycosylhydrolase [Uliginosibacterium sp. 31-12]